MHPIIILLGEVSASSRKINKPLVVQATAKGGEIKTCTTTLMAEMNNRNESLEMTASPSYGHGLSEIKMDKDV